MSPTRAPALHAAAPPGLLSALVLAGCSKKDEPTGPRGDATGEHLVAVATDRGRTAGDLGIALYDLDLGGFHALPNLYDAGSESDPCVSNDGRFLAFAAARGGGTTGGNVYLYDRLNEVLLPTPGLNSVRDESWPRFSYDSVHLAFVTAPASGERRGRVDDPLGDTLVPLPGLDAPGGFDDDMPAPNVDGGRIAFVTNRAGTHDVKVWDRATGIGAFTFLASAGDDIEPSLSSNGRWLAYASNNAGAGGYDVFLYDLVADSLVSLTGLNSAGDDRHPSISSDGDVIVFQSNRAGGGGQYDLYLFTRSTGELSQPAAFKDASDDIQPYLRWR